MSAGSINNGMIGLREVLLGANFTQTTRAATDVELWRINGADLDAVVAQYPDVGLHLYAAATKQLTALAEELQVGAFTYDFSIEFHASFVHVALEPLNPR